MKDTQQVVREKLAALSALEVKQWFELAEKPDVSKITITDVIEKISNHIVHLTLPVATHRLYRCRPLKEGEVPPKILSGVLSPPAKATNLGRCNLDGKPVLYVSDSPDILIQECHIEAGQQFVISQFNRLENVQEDISCFLLGIEPRVLLGDTPQVKEIEKYKTEFLGDGYKILRKVERLLHKSFIRDDDPSGLTYTFTANLCDHVFSINHYADAIFYPSIATNASGRNFAIKPGIIDKAFEPVKFGSFVLNHDGTVEREDGATLGKGGAIEWGKDVSIDNPIPVGARMIDPDDPDIYIAPWKGPPKR